MRPQLGDVGLAGYSPGKDPLPELVDAECADGQRREQQQAARQALGQMRPAIAVTAEGAHGLLELREPEPGRPARVVAWSAVAMGVAASAAAGYMFWRVDEAASRFARTPQVQVSERDRLREESQRDGAIATGLAAAAGASLVTAVLLFILDTGPEGPAGPPDPVVTPLRASSAIGLELGASWR